MRPLAVAYGRVMNDELERTLQSMPVEVWLPYFIRRMDENGLTPLEMFDLLREIKKLPPDADDQTIKELYRRWKTSKISG
jgi:hypothetical protein